MAGGEKGLGPLYERLVAEILAEAHRYVPGLAPDRPTRVATNTPAPLRAARQGRERARDLVERAAARAGFARRHFDPAIAAARLSRALALSDGFEATYALLADEASRRRLVDLLKLRVLGPYHAPLAVRPETFRAKQTHADSTLQIQAATFDVSDPWFTPLSLYRVPVEGGTPVTLHSHSVDVVSVYLLGQYSYAHEETRVAVEPGDVVLDIGGCWGDTALYFASLVGPTGKVYTFEFDPESLRVLRENLALNPELAARVEVVERALWDRSGESLGFVGAGRMTHVVEDGSAQAEHEVATITLDDFTEQARLERIDFVKMDVEGAEPRVLSGARESLRRFQPKLAIAAYHGDDDLVRLPAMIESVGAGYRYYLDTASPLEDETVLFATAPRNST